MQSGRHPRNGRMFPLALHVADLPAGVALVPGAVELLGRPPELHDEIAREVLRLGLAPFLPPQSDQSGLIIAHDDPGIRTADEEASVQSNCLRPMFHFGSFI